MISSTAVLAATLALVPGPATAAAKRGTCYPPHSRTLIASARTRVFETRHVIGEHARDTYGCLLSRRRPVRFAVLDFPLGFGPIVLAGPFVAYGAYSDCAAGYCDPNSVVVQDLRDSRTRYADGPIAVAHIQSLVLKRTGSLAWIGTSYDRDGQRVPGLQVVAVPAGGSPVVVDAGTDIDGASLALAGTTLFWTRGGAPRSTVLH